MPQRSRQEKNCKLLRPARSHHKKKKKKGAAPAPKNKEKPLVLSLAPDTLPVSMLSHPKPGPSQEHFPKLKVFSKKDKKLSAGGQKTKRCHKDSQFLPKVTHKTSKNGFPARGTELSFQTRESLRWEGVLQDPQEEARRLELYRTNRRQRYIAQREALTNAARLETNFLKKS